LTGAPHLKPNSHPFKALAQSFVSDEIVFAKPMNRRSIIPVRLHPQANPITANLLNYRPSYAVFQPLTVDERCRCSQGRPSLEGKTVQTLIVAGLSLQ
jgi:hypothetical protein